MCVDWLTHTHTHTLIAGLSHIFKHHFSVVKRPTGWTCFLDSPVLRQVSLLIGPFGTSCLRLDCLSFSFCELLELIWKARCHVDGAQRKEVLVPASGQWWLDVLCLLCPPLKMLYWVLYRRGSHVINPCKTVKWKFAPMHLFLGQTASLWLDKLSHGPIVWWKCSDISPRASCSTDWASWAAFDKNMLPSSFKFSF